MRPFDGFRLNSAIFASIWLVFLVPVALQVYMGEGFSTTAKAWMTVCLLAFGAFYFYAFGSLKYFPRDWGTLARALLRWGILLAIALASVPAMKSGAVSFAPYLAAMLGFTVTLRKALPIVVATGVLGTVAVWNWSPDDLTWAAFTLFGMPLMLVALGIFSQYDESRHKLRHDLDLAQQREDIATDVHDLLGHSLTVINLKSEVARRAMDSNPEQAKQELKEISDLSRLALAEVRSTVTRMRTPTFAGELQAARRALETKGVTAHLPELLKAPGAHDTVFSWGLRELTTNVVRHSGASTCWVSVTDDKLQVTDDGSGFNSEATQGTGGLAGLRERVEEAGGKLIVRRERGLSTVLIAMEDDDELIDDSAVAEEAAR